MNVQLTNTMIDNYNLSHLISERCRQPDHSVLTLKFTCSSFCDLEHNKDDYRITGDSLNKEKHVGQGIPKNYLFKNVPIEFFNNVMCKNALDTMLNRLQQCEVASESLDNLYRELTETVMSEMDKHLQYNNVCQKKGRKKLKVSKPFWNDELTCLWKNMRMHEKCFPKCKGSYKNKCLLRKRFSDAQKAFDKKLRFFERQ